MVNITIDGRKIKAKQGATILETARGLKIDIPTLCYHKELRPFGACRLCMVEVKANGKWKLTTSCTTPVENGMEIKTGSDRARESRKFAAGLLYYKYPEDKTVRETAKKLGVDVDEKRAATEQCILCGLCVRACREIVDVNALQFQDRGLGRDVEEPKVEFNPALCIGCGSCAFVCPTSYVKMEEAGGKRTIWNKVFKMASCKVCGRYFAPQEQLEYISRKTGVPMDKLMVCVSCR
ncbi:MAG: 2Fe-2S iron-sulfur cluster-binding protein [Syntrophales bacterium]